jgi:hypothetical protein
MLKRERRSLAGWSRKPPEEYYAVERRVAATVPLEEELDRVLSEGILDSARLGEIARLGARLIIQRSLEEEVAARHGGPRSRSASS